MYTIINSIREPLPCPALEESNARKRSSLTKLLTTTVNKLGKTAHEYIHKDRSLKDVTGG
jgi:hypothetical protein